ncbi:amino acid permease [Bacillus timonensis]|uniref:Amino acid permease n=1 Tax=Bacillus timonensis TaxID=1033734 RepID=A0A4S3PQE7_9BACI|nr:sodium/solute symporter [Bacillus timonensis]THE11860.1 amino acid permease [Bacillus timonensis]
MESNVIQYLIVLFVYFVGMLVLGFWFNKKAHSEKDYFIAKDKLGAAVIGFSYSATQMSGSTFMGSVGQKSVIGYSLMPAGIASASAPWFTYVLLGERIRKLSDRLKSVTISDIFEARYYSKFVGIVTCIIMLCAFIPMISAQFQAAAVAFEVILGVPYLVGLFIFGIVVILYTTVGGMLAVAWTDLIQGILMIIGFMILAPIVLYATGGFSEMNIKYGEINPEGMALIGAMSPLWVISSFIVWGFFQIGGAPASVTRFLIPKDDKTLKKALIYSISFQSLMYICAAIIAIGGAVILPNLEKADMLVPTLIFEYLHPVFGGIVLAAVLGAMMSTIDSILLLAGSLVTVNIVPKITKKQLDTSKRLKIGKISTLVIGLLAILIAIDPPAAIFWVVTMSFSIMASAFTFPLLLGIWWPRATKEGGIAGIIGGVVSCIVWYILGYIEYQSFSIWIGGIWPAVFGSMVSLVLVTVVSYLTKPAPQEVIDTFFDDILIDKPLANEVVNAQKG